MTQDVESRSAGPTFRGDGRAPAPGVGDDLRPGDELLAGVALRYGVAVGAVAVAILLKLALQRVLAHETPFLMFFPAVMVAAWYGGLKPGLLATVLSGIASFFFFPRDYAGSGFLTVRVGLFVLECVFVCLLAQTLHNARRRAERNEAIARDLERTLAGVSDAEQRRIGQDLHDGLGQHLTGVALLSKALQQKLTAAGRPEAADAGEIAELVNESIDWTRDMARGLALLDLDRTNLAGALRELAAKTERLCRVMCTFDGPAEVAVPDDATALNLYRVAQEAVNNAVKHARAGSVRIALAERGDGRVALTVADDGVGLPPPRPAGPARHGTTMAAAAAAGGNGHARPAPDDADPDAEDDAGEPAPRAGMGLEIMKYRASVVGAEFSIRSAPGRGTTVSCVLADRAAAARRPGVEGLVHGLDGGAIRSVESNVLERAI